LGTRPPVKFLQRAILLLFISPRCWPAQRPSEPSEEEQFFFDSANRERAAQQLPPLKWDNALAEAARRHALLMSDQNNLSHQLPDELPLDRRAAQAGARFSQVGENIAVGRHPPAIHIGWMHSPGHRANILDAHFTAIGVGVIEDDGELYAVEDFSIAITSVTIEEQEEKVAALLAAKGLRVSSERGIARKVCADEIAPKGNGPMLILSYETPDISKLPEPLLQNVRDGMHREAAVGACQPKESADGFARFRITVLLFGSRREAAKR
jgi:cysteine-rich secretory family protein